MSEAPRAGIHLRRLKSACLYLIMGMQEAYIALNREDIRLAKKMLEGFFADAKAAMTGQDALSEEYWGIPQDLSHRFEEGPMPLWLLELLSEELPLDAKESFLTSLILDADADCGEP